MEEREREEEKQKKSKSHRSQRRIQASPGCVDSQVPCKEALSGEGQASTKLVRSLSLSFQQLTGQQWRSLPPLHLDRVPSVQVQPDSLTRNDSLSFSPRACRAVFFFCCLCVCVCVIVRRHVHAEVNKASPGTFQKASESRR